jgi:hypothetical protein
MAYLASKLFAGLFGLWAVFGLSGANVGFYNPDPSTPPSPVSMVYEGYDRPVEVTKPTTTTITTIGDCSDVVSLAASLGWPASELDTLRRIANAESSCKPWAHNATDPHTGSYGLMQINGFWCLPNTYWPTGWLQAQGFVATCDDLFSATANLQAALAIWQQTGWQAWSTY